MYNTLAVETHFQAASWKDAITIRLHLLPKALVDQLFNIVTIYSFRQISHYISCERVRFLFWISPGNSISSCCWSSMPSVSAKNGCCLQLWTYLWHKPKKHLFINTRDFSGATCILFFGSFRCLTLVEGLVAPRSKEDNTHSNPYCNATNTTMKKICSYNTLLTKVTIRQYPKSNLTWPSGLNKQSSQTLPLSTFPQVVDTATSE